jgi:hypothetical protein
MSERLWEETTDVPHGDCSCKTQEELLAEMGGRSILWCDTHEERIPAPGHSCKGWSPFAKCHEVAAWLVVPEGGER